MSAPKQGNTLTKSESITTINLRCPDISPDNVLYERPGLLGLLAIRSRSVADDVPLTIPARGLSVLFLDQEKSRLTMMSVEGSGFPDQEGYCDPYDKFTRVLGRKNLGGVVAVAAWARNAAAKEGKSNRSRELSQTFFKRVVQNPNKRSEAVAIPNTTRLGGLVSPSTIVVATSLSLDPSILLRASDLENGATLNTVVSQGCKIEGYGAPKNVDSVFDHARQNEQVIKPWLKSSSV